MPYNDDPVLPNGCFTAFFWMALILGVIMTIVIIFAVLAGVNLAYKNWG